ncbi:MAG: amylo-alpha-1,6-glucosidase [Firmicutes bacterium]|nr:amylo-alpha-1,6-glucosidase [Bacillota bacterium]
MEQIIKHDRMFFVSDAQGDVPGGEGKAYGLYLGDTRVLSRYRMALEGVELVPVSASARAGDGGRVMFAGRVPSQPAPDGELMVERSRVIRGGLVERIRIMNHGAARRPVQLSLELAADFRDMFEVRGMSRPARGRPFPPTLGDGGLWLRYRGLDGREYATQVRFCPKPVDLALLEPGEGGAPGARAVFSFEVDPGDEFSVEVAVTASIIDAGKGAEPQGRTQHGVNDGVHPEGRWVSSVRFLHYGAAREQAERDKERWRAGCARWRTDNAEVNAVLERSAADVHMLLTDFGFGPMPVAGVPWYAVPFGRDSLITAMEMLAVRPGMAAATLRTLAAWQGRRIDQWRDEAPGKILHELRSGEMARAAEIPFGPYYGTVDATPLFLIAAGEYWRFTGDTEFIRELLPSLEAAGRWMDEEGDQDGDGYVEYHRRQSGGLVNQGWKDSGDAIVHPDGRLARPPIALAEVQGYVYAARRHLADMLDACGRREAAVEQRRRAEKLRGAFERDFWLEETGFYALALDGDKRPVATVTSNPGHCLWSRIVSEARAARVSEVLMSEGMFSGYGVRTLSAAERVYHPLSYHRGSVWPHDSALTAMGLARYGLGEAAARIASGLFKAASFDPYRRLPELFGGFPAGEEGPVWYPVACIPQAWAAAAPFLLLRAALGLEPDAPRDRLALSPHLPEGINRVEVTGLVFGRRRINVTVERQPGGGAAWDVEVVEGEPLAVGGRGPAPQPETERA